MSKWDSIALCVFFIVAGACVAMFVWKLPSGRDGACHGGVFKADSISGTTCRGARVALEERGGERYAVCTCGPEAAPLDAGTDAEVEP